MDKLDYTDSGLSTPQALADAQQRTERMLTDRRMPRRLARLLSRVATMRMRCDGANCPRVGTTTGKLDTDGRWSHSGGWVHRADLDFCPDCQANGAMNAAVAAGVRPRGA